MPNSLLNDITTNGSVDVVTIPGLANGETMDVSGIGNISSVIGDLTAAQTAGTLNIANGTGATSPIASDLNEFIVNSGSVSVPGGYQAIIDNVGTANTIVTSDATDSVIGGASGMTLWDHSANETVYVGGGNDTIGMSATTMESLNASLAGNNDIVAVGFGDATVSGGGASNIIFGSGTNAAANLTTDMTQGASTIIAGIGNNTLDLGSSGVIFGGNGTNHDTVSGNGNYYVEGNGNSTVTAGASDIVFGGVGSMDVTMGGTNSIFVGNGGADTINATTGLTGWAGGGAENFIVNGAATIIGGGATTVNDQSGTSQFYNLGTGAMTINAATSSTAPVINDQWGGANGMVINDSANGNTVNVSEGAVTVNASGGNDSVNTGNNANGVINLDIPQTIANDPLSSTVTLWGTGDFTVNNNNSYNQTTINGGNASGNLTFNVTDNNTNQMITSGSGQNTYNFNPSQPNASLTAFVEKGTNTFDFTPQNTAVQDTVKIFDYNAASDYFDFSGFSSSQVQGFATAAQNSEYGTTGPVGTQFTVGNTTVMFTSLGDAGVSQNSNVPFSINSSHFVHM